MKQTLQHIKKYFTIWWISVITNFLAIGIFFLGTLFKRDWIIDLSLIVFFVNIVGTIISSIVQIVIRKWYFIFPQLGLASFLFYYVGIIMTYSPPDYYGAHKEIPENIDFSNPLDSLATNAEFKEHEFVLINGFQPGLYIYQTDHIPKETGHFYIKAFEINSNDQLSGERMKVRSKVVVDNLEPQIWKGEFTVYEGDWGDKYVSRMDFGIDLTKDKNTKSKKETSLLKVGRDEK